MRKTVLLLLIVISTFKLSAQWAQRAPFPGGTRTKATSFRIGDKIYLLGGLNSIGVTLRDLWVYDIPSNTWMQKADFTGPERYGAASFVLNDVAYVGTGGNDNGYLDDLWQYNATSDTWIQKNGLPAGSAQHENQRVEAFAFSIGNKAYLGGGGGFVFGANSTNPYAFFDLWEYTPAGSQWTPVSGIPDFTGRYLSIAAVINNKAYVGLGCDAFQTTNHQTFWEYDPATDMWTSKAAFPSVYTVDASAFVMNSQLYVAGGVELSGITLSDQVYSYDPSNDTWSQLPAFTGGAIAGGIAASNDSTAFLGTGYRSNLTPRTDFWELSSVNTGISFPVSNKESGIKVFPNPFTNSTTFYTCAGVKSCEVEIFDACGKQVSQFILGAENKTLQRGNLESGIYFYHVVSAGKIIDRGKLMVE